MRDRSQEADPPLHAQILRQRFQRAPILALACEQQRDVGQLRQRADQQVLPLAGDQRADAEHDRPVEVERGLGRLAVHQFERVEIDPGIMDADLVGIDAHARHRAAHRVRHGEQAGGVVRGLAHQLARARLRPPIMDVGAARLDRIGDAQRPGEAAGDRAVGKEEAGVDDVEGLFGVQAAHQQQDGAGHGADIGAAADLGQDAEGRAIDGEFAPALLARQRAQRGIMGGERERPIGDAHRRDHRHVGVRATGQLARLAFDEHAEIGPAHVGEEGRQRKDVECHGPSFDAQL